MDSMRHKVGWELFDTLAPICGRLTNNDLVEERLDGNTEGDVRVVEEWKPGCDEKS